MPSSTVAAAGLVNFPKRRCKRLLSSTLIMSVFAILSTNLYDSAGFELERQIQTKVIVYLDRFTGRYERTSISNREVEYGMWRVRKRGAQFLNLQP